MFVSAHSSPELPIESGLLEPWAQARLYLAGEDHLLDAMVDAATRITHSRILTYGRGEGRVDETDPFGDLSPRAVMLQTSEVLRAEMIEREGLDETTPVRPLDVSRFYTALGIEPVILNPAPRPHGRLSFRREGRTAETTDPYALVRDETKGLLGTLVLARTIAGYRPGEELVDVVENLRNGMTYEAAVYRGVHDTVMRKTKDPAYILIAKEGIFQYGTDAEAVNRRRLVRDLNATGHPSTQMERQVMDDYRQARDETSYRSQAATVTMLMSGQLMEQWNLRSPGTKKADELAWGFASLIHNLWGPGHQWAENNTALVERLKAEQPADAQLAS
jgi:hypothetical protein